MLFIKDEIILHKINGKAMEFKKIGEAKKKISNLIGKIIPKIKEFFIKPAQIFEIYA